MTFFLFCFLFEANVAEMHLAAISYKCPDTYCGLVSMIALQQVVEICVETEECDPICCFVGLLKQTVS